MSEVNVWDLKIICEDKIGKQITGGGNKEFIMQRSLHDESKLLIEDKIDKQCVCCGGIKKFDWISGNCCFLTCE